MRKEDLMKKGEEEEEEEEAEVRRSEFPADFIFGVATSAYQIEGGCNEGNRGPSIWDAFTHSPGTILDGSNGDVAVDHYHRYKEDIDLISKLGFDAYRFSISWSRIYPDGLGTKVNDDGIAFYNNVITYLLEKGIQPFVTLYHWDLPLHLQELIGGWLNKEIVKYFAIYADTCFACFGDRVKTWITINEPLQTAINGYDSGIFAPGRHEQSSTEPYLVAHHQILAHATAVSIYRDKYKVTWKQRWKGLLIGVPQLLKWKISDLGLKTNAQTRIPNRRWARTFALSGSEISPEPRTCAGRQLVLLNWPTPHGALSRKSKVDKLAWL